MIYRKILQLFFPNRCVGCGEIIDEEEFICEYCAEMLERCLQDKMCSKCGCLKKECDCNKRVYSFNGICAPFFNTGIAQSVVYAFKFRQKESYAEFLAEEMVLALKQKFNDINFDFVTFVPMYKSAKRRRSYNQSELLAEKIGAIISLPVYDNILRSKKKKRRQFTTPLNERFDNVKGIYYTDLRLNGETVLLIDDIKTTGATLQECAKALLIAGADNVYCLTCLTTKKKKGNSNGNRYRN